MTHTLTFFILSLILIFSLGYKAQRIGLCMVRGVEQATRGNFSFILAILFSGAFAWIAMLILQFNQTSVHFGTYQASIYSILGGFLFGLGAAFNQGCGVSTISRLVKGHSSMIATVLGWFIGWILLSDYAQSIPHQKLSFDLTHQTFLLMGFSIILLGLILKFDKSNRQLWFDLFIIGFMASLIFLYEPKWTPSGLLKDVSLSIWKMDDTTWPQITRFILILFLMLGMFIAAVRQGDLKPRRYSLFRYLGHLAAGTLMGIGAVLAGGGNDAQLLIALPSLSPAGFASIFFMISGIFIGLKFADWLKTKLEQLNSSSLKPH